MDTKIIENIKFVHILYTKIVQIKTFYDNECTRNIHQIPTSIQKKKKKKIQTIKLVQSSNQKRLQT